MTRIFLNFLKLSIKLTRNLHNSPQCNAKPGAAMKKIMSGGSKKRRIFSITPLLPSTHSLGKGSLEGKYSGNSKRAIVLNKLFMRYITDIMAHGENSEAFLGWGIEVSRVQISPDYRSLNVFWVTKDRLNEDLVGEILQKNAGSIRHELSTLRVMGEVPTIQFLKDKRYGEIIELDNRLTKADYGDDYKPIELVSKLKMQLELYTSLDEETREKIQTLEDDCDYEEPLPAMPQNVFDLNRADIIKRIKQTLNKSAALHRLNKTEEVERTVNENPISYSSNKEKRIAFKRFLQERELIRSKSMKTEHTQDLLDLEYIREEQERQRPEFYDNLGICDSEIEDYLSEDEK